MTDANRTYHAIKQQLLGLDMTPATFVDPGDTARRTTRQRKISNALVSHGIDLATFVDACRSRYPKYAERNRVHMSGNGVIVFRGPWQLEHLLVVLAEHFRVTDHEINGVPSTPPDRRVPTRPATSSDFESVP